MSTLKAADQQISQIRFLALASYLGLLALMLIWQVWCQSDSEFSLTFRLVLWVLPLLFPLPGLLRGKPYTYAWTNFVLMWYYLHSLTMLYVAPAERGFAVAELVLTTGAFVGCTWYARRQGRALGLGLKKLKDQD
ncbi:DUF2069 domain-containing protein [Pseudidiomarina donghaiensis]|uniref:DUF2069 domain-containing protein n=1 Tax=Pseudidiomarina donghaiensis TaxID=519452 RepID=A0A432XD86_9GAMM|nr:DUF2069 domain-containing protein [Pseudidiomarina donghaiensis]RUO46517.1 DUF2069 domain-containing protein [Pseudidiomarina donghaiensis]SFV24642.1 Uncharacterized membrane protein [Pseudidiomarina donghaiensis]